VVRRKESDEESAAGEKKRAFPATTPASVQSAEKAT
jgi:hypothetical protein